MRLAGRCECGVALNLATGPEHGVCRGELPLECWPEPVDDAEPKIVFAPGTTAREKKRIRNRAARATMAGWYLRQLERRQKKRKVDRRSQADAVLASVTEALEFLTA